MKVDLSRGGKVIQVSHYVGLSGVGGVQRNFVEYMEFELKQETNYKHKVYTNGKVDSQYNLPVNILNIRNLFNLFSLILDIVSRKKIVHFYNNLSSPKVALLLLVLPVSNLIVHERGTAWNLSSKYGFLLRFIAWKATLILANSQATKIILEKKFFISDTKIKIIHNGIDTSIKCGEKPLTTKAIGTFYVGFIGRLDTPKGIHVLIEAMHYLTGKNIKLIIAGDGSLKDKLKIQAIGLKNIQFVGRVKNPLKFLTKIHLLVVPSIREPLGNVCIEAGLCKVPVLASNIDGIPEIIENYVTGELIKPTKPITFETTVDAMPIPEYVVDPTTQQLCSPMQIDPSELADRISTLSQDPERLSQYAEKLHKKVTNYFSISRYAKELRIIYLNLAS